MISLEIPVEKIPYVRTIEGRKFKAGKWEFPDSALPKLQQYGLVSSDIKVAYFQKMREVLENQGLREPNEIEPPCIEAMKVVAKHKLDLFQTTGKASLYK